MQCGHYPRGDWLPLQKEGKPDECKHHNVEHVLVCSYTQLCSIILRNKSPEMRDQQRQLCNDRFHMVANENDKEAVTFSR